MGNARAAYSLFIVISLLAAKATAVAYTSSARTSLLKSRDQVADQRQNLQRAYNDIDRKIDELQNQKYQIGHYLTDCDKTLKDLDRALNAQDSAYRGR
jgi:septal ring factor EnvC (AmiA/AmiB activator)